VIESLSERKEMIFDEVQALIVLSMPYCISFSVISPVNGVVLYSN
jgi:hypothetical protein